MIRRGSKSKAELDGRTGSVHFRLYMSVSCIPCLTSFHKTTSPPPPSAVTFRLISSVTPLSSHLSCIPQTVRHGFPYQPSSMAFDPVQKILAIGTQSGALRLYPLNQRCRSLRLVSATASPERPRQVSLSCCSHVFTHTCWGGSVCVCVRLMKRFRLRSWFLPSPGCVWTLKFKLQMLCNGKTLH